MFRWALPTVLAIGAAALFASPVQVTQPAPAAAAGDGPPNVVVIITDDQAKGTLDAMPNVKSLIRDPGVNFENGIIPTSLCCPSRSSLLSGNQSHSTSVYTNQSSTQGGWQAFQDNENLTLATELNDAGYRTGLLGKYLNGYQKSGYEPSPGETYVPPGWDTFLTFRPSSGEGDGAYYNYSLVGTNELGPYEEAPADYSTDVLAQRAVNFINSTPSETPLFLMFAPYGPHGDPNPLDPEHKGATPAPRHDGDWANAILQPFPGTNETDVTDKPDWIADLPDVSTNQQVEVLRSQHEALMSIDDATASIVSALGPRLDNTLLVFMSDNGYMLGVHRLTGKDVPHRKSSEVFLSMRWDDAPAGSTLRTLSGGSSERVTPNIDVTATIAEAAGVSWSMEGRSALSQDRFGVLLEQTETAEHPAYCGWRSKNYVYVEYDVGEGREFYNYGDPDSPPASVDPHELDNLVSTSNKYLKEKRDDMKDRAQTACSPAPPGFSWVN